MSVVHPGAGNLGPARVLIVDDEASARGQLRRFLASHPGVTVVGEARDGEEALAVFDETRPDIVLLDIRMPRMDGITAARHMHRKASKTHIVFLTAHPEFEYAREAVRLGAIDYVVKPIRQDEFRNALRRVLASRGREVVREARARETEEVVRSLLPFMRRDYLNILITRPSLFDRSELEAQARALGLNLPPRLVVVADVMGKDPAHTNPAAPRGPGHPSLLAEVAGVPPSGSGRARAGDPGTGWGTALVDWPGGEVLAWRERGRLILALSPGPDESADPDKWVSRAVGWVRDSLGDQAQVAAGTYCWDVRDFPGSYRAALSKLGASGTFSAARLLGLEADLCEAALKGDMPRVVRLAGEILGDLRHDDAVGEARVLAGLIGTAFVRGGLAVETVARLRQEFEELLSERPGPLEPDAPAVVTGLVEELGRRLADSTSVGERAVLAAKAYVEAHYSEPLNLRRVAAMVYLSPYYFARLFKLHTGMTLGEYVTEVRLGRACDLLRSTDQTIHKVAGKVGYSSGSYFSSLFTRRFGVSPNQFRERGAR
ncbi:MAG: response regulator [Bacillota bacterium]|nr:MAG: response regulator [Bacillota bacterium]